MKRRLGNKNDFYSYKIILYHKCYRKSYCRSNIIKTILNSCKKSFNRPLLYNKNIKNL